MTRMSRHRRVLGAFDQAILPPLTFKVLLNLRQARLANVDIGALSRWSFWILLMAALPLRLPLLRLGHRNQQARQKVFRFAANLAGKRRAGVRWRRKQVQLDHRVFPPGLSATDEGEEETTQGDGATRQG